MPDALAWLKERPQQSEMYRHLSFTVLKSVGGVLLVLGGLALFPEMASAQCGNYVTILGSPSASQQMPDEHMPKAPCNGPGCSQLPSVPFTPLPAPIVTNVESKACVDFLGQPPQSAGERANPDANSDRPVRMSNSIFHPPRVG